MKKENILILLVIFITGCKETPPFIDFSEKIAGLKDTTYMVVSVPASDSTMIFVEDLTGVRCTNCPKAADKIKEIRSANPGKVVSVGAYPWALKQLMDPYPGFEILNTNEADDIFVGVYNSPTAIPTGGVNRKIFAGETSYYISYNKWAGKADIIKTQESSVKIESTLLSYDNVSRKARIRVKVIFTKSYPELLNMTVYLTESKIISRQLMPDGKESDTYEHNHVLRKSLTSYSGIPLKIDAQTSGNYLAGRTFEKDFEIELNTKWVKDNCAFVILVNRFDTNSKEVLQASELEIK